MKCEACGSTTDIHQTRGFGPSRRLCQGCRSKRTQHAHVVYKGSYNYEYLIQGYKEWDRENIKEQP